MHLNPTDTQIILKYILLKGKDNYNCNKQYLSTTRITISLAICGYPGLTKMTRAVTPALSFLLFEQPLQCRRGLRRTRVFGKPFGNAGSPFCVDLCTQLVSGLWRARGSSNNLSNIVGFLLSPEPPLAFSSRLRFDRSRWFLICLLFALLGFAYLHSLTDASPSQIGHVVISLG